MSNIPCVMITTGIFFGTFASAPVNAAPEQLRGKSIVITWSESRVQRDSGWADFRSLLFSGEYDIYVGGTGRIFSRQRYTNRARDTGTSDRVGNTRAGTTTFQGDMLVITQSSGTGAKRILVKFGAGFSSCDASIVRAKEAGHSAIKTKSIIFHGVTVEIRSVEISDVSCRIESGNVFAGR